MILEVMDGPYDWVAAFDGDTGVVSADRCVESLVRDNATELLFEERFHNGEIAAGGYLVKNSEFGRSFLRKWAWFQVPATAGFHNSDNGAVHMLFLQVLGLPESQCMELWRHSHSIETYDRYVGCCVKLLIREGSAPNIRLVRRGQGFSRDVWVTNNQVSEADFFLHAMKEHVQIYEENDGCGTELYMPRFNIRVMDVQDMTPIMRAADVAECAKRPILEEAFVRDCWPNCPEYW